MPGDAVLCDDTGVVVLGAHEAEHEARRAIERQAVGLKTQERMAHGAKLDEISGASGKVLASV